MNGVKSPHFSSPRQQDRGFTLVELLIVIVILGILATVTVFAIRGITDKGQENAEASDLKTMATAAEAFYAQNGRHAADETELADPSVGMLQAESDLFDYTLNADNTYTITNVRTGLVASTGASGAGGGAAGGANQGGLSGTPVSIGGVPAVSVGSGSNVVLWMGGDASAAIWNAAVDAGRGVAVSGMPGGDTLIFMNISQIADYGALRSVVDSAEAGLAYYWYVAEDDVADFCPNSDGDPISFGSCVGFAQIEGGHGYEPNAWPRNQIDGLFDDA